MVAFLGFLYLQPGGDTQDIPDSGGTNFISRFNPFRSSKPETPAPTTPSGVNTGTPTIDNQEIPKLIKVSSEPVAGYAVFSKERLKEVISDPSSIPPSEGGEVADTPPSKQSLKGLTPPKTEFAPALRYVSKKEGIIYQTFADKIEEKKFSKTVIPKVYDAYIGNHGQSVIMRYLKTDDQTITTFVGTLPKELAGEQTMGDKEIKGTFLPENVKDISVSRDTTKIFYLFESASTSGENIIGTTLNLIDNKKVQIFDSPFTEWLSWWANEKMITLSTKPSSGALGYVYTINPSSKNLTKILGDINGLSTLGSPDGKLILFSGNDVSLNIYHTDTRNSDILGIKTLPEKCVWGGVSDVIYCAVPKSIPSLQYPDAWYQGEVSFSDALWKIDLKTGNATMLEDPIINGEDIDGIKLALDEGENYLFFVNKKDSYLWKLDLR